MDVMTAKRNSSRSGQDGAGGPPPRDRHKPRKLVALAGDLHSALRELADENDRTLTRELRRAVIEYLERSGRWPPQRSR